MDLQIYYNTIKVRFEKHPLNIFQLFSNRQYRRWMRTYFPNTPIEEHKKLRDEAYARERALQKEWWDVFEQAFEKIHKRHFQNHDFESTSFGRHDFPEETKKKLRDISEAKHKFWSIRSAHTAMLPKHLAILRVYDV